MARKFLVPINLDKNALLNATLHPSGTAPTSPVAGQAWYDSTNNVLKIYNGTSWVTLADTSSTGVTSLSGTANEVNVSASTGAITIGLPDSVTVTTDLTVGNNLTVTGDLTVNGTTTTINTTNLAVEDNIVILNSGVTATPSTNAGIEVERGTSTNASITWNETTDKWTAGLAGSEAEISLSGHSHTASDVTDFTEAVQDAVDGVVVAGSGISKTYNDGANTLTIANTGVLSVNGVTGSVSASDLLTAIKTVDGAGSGLDADTLDGVSSAGFALASHTHTSADVTDFTEAVQDAVGAALLDTATVDLTHDDANNQIKADVKLAVSDSYLLTASGLAVDVSTLESKLVTDSFTKKYAANVGNSTDTSIVVTHNLGSRDVTVNVYDASTYETVECDVARTTTNTVTLGFAVAPATNAFRVVIVG